MKKNNCINGKAMSFRRWKIFLIMKLLAIFILGFILQSNALDTQAQNKRLSLQFENKSLKEVLLKLEDQTEFSFIYKDEMINPINKVSGNFKDEKVTDLLNKVLQNTGLTYMIEGRAIVILSNDSETVIEQQKSVSGKVSDSTGSPLPGVSVVVKGTTTGVITDMDGKYVMAKVPENAILQFSFVGMKGQEIPIGSKTSINITLEDEIVGLAEVVAVGYGSQRAKDITAAISTISLQGLKDRPVLSAGDAIQGKTAGVQVISNTGKPGSGLALFIRGAASSQGSTSPLVVIDGVYGDINSVDPSNIKEISILKDAAAAGIYGASGSTNGVVLITTKSGIKNSLKLDFSSYAGIQTITKKLSVLNSGQMQDFYKDLDKGQSSPYALDQSLLSNNNNWQDLIYQTAPIIGANLSVSGGTDKSTYNLGLGYLDQDGIINNSGYKRYSLNMSLENEITDWLAFGANINYSRSNTNNVLDNTGGRGGGIILSALTAPTWSPIITPYNFVLGTNAGIVSPYANIYGRQSPIVENKILGNAHMQIKLPYNITYRSQFGITGGSEFATDFLDPELIASPINQGLSGSGSYATSDLIQYQWDNTFNYEKKINKNSFKLLLGSSYMNWSNTVSNQNSGNFTVGISTLNGASTILGSSTSKGEYSSMSYFSRLNYEYDNKYLIAASIRRDGSSKFGIYNRWANFPGISLGWRMSSEEFMQNSKTISDLKIRASMGSTGNSPSSLYPSYSLLGSGFNGTINGSSLSNGVGVSGTLGNPNLKWESTSQINTGIDVSFINRISVTVDYFNKKTTDLLFNKPLPISSGSSNKWVNLNSGYVQNSGFEFTISGLVMDKSDFKWNANLNLSFNKNIVKDLDPSEYVLNGVSTVRNNLPLGAFWGYDFLGVDTETGNAIYRDLDNDGAVTIKDKGNIGDPVPVCYYGFSNEFQYKGISLNFMIDGAFGNEVYNQSLTELSQMTNYSNQSTVVLNRWRNVGDVTNVPKAIFSDPTNSTDHQVSNSDLSSRFVEDGSYLRMRTITLGYDFSNELCKKVGLSNLRLFTTVENAFIITNYTGYSPDLGVSNNPTMLGVDYGTYPKARSVTFGIKIQL